MNQEAPTNPDGSARAQTSSDNDDQTFLSTDGSHWWHSVSSHVTAAQLQQHNIVRINARPTSYSTCRMIRCSPLSLEKEFGRGQVLLGILAMESVYRELPEALQSNVNITIDEQLLPCKVRCKFIQYNPNKPDKFGIKFWMAVNVESKYLCNGFPYLGRT